jgi:hypothetical protein
MFIDRRPRKSDPSSGGAACRPFCCSQQYRGSQLTSSAHGAPVLGPNFESGALTTEVALARRRVRPTNPDQPFGRGILDCGGKRSATPLSSVW